MANATRQIRRSTVRSPSRWLKLPSGVALNAALLAVAGVAALVVFGFSADARLWAVESLGYGWILVAAWAGGVLMAVRYRPRWTVRHWRVWVLAAAGVAATVGILSFFYASAGPLAYEGLSGQWGGALAGPGPGLGLAKLAAVLALVPPVLYPRRAGRVYLYVLGRALSALGVMGVYGYRGARRGVRFAARTAAGLRRAGYHRLPVLWAKSLLSYPWRLKRRRGAVTATLPAYSRADLDPVSYAEEIPDPWPARAAPEVNGGGQPAPPDPDPQPVRGGNSQWKLPPLSLLTPAEPHKVSQAPLQDIARQIEGTLAEHGVTVEVKDIKAGPRIVRFGLVPGWVRRKGESGKEDSSQRMAERSRVKVQSILTREKDLALALKTPFLRIEAPVPGEALVGLEMPTPSPTKVMMREAMEIPEFRKITGKGGLPIALGADTGGNQVVMDLASLPHILIAGATGSGKSVCINSIVASLLMTKPPDQMRMLMVDPKRVELTPFNGIPHLIAPIIVEAEEVKSALRGLMREMFRRYKQMEEAGARNISAYNAKARDGEKMPYLVLIVDELADLMMVGGYEIEQNLVRLAQLGRATGIHLVLATQRPSVNVVTGLLKANIAARVAFAVASQVDSRVIMDTVGAEKLLGKGDMLLLNNDSPRPRRVQGALVLDEEIDQLVEFWLNQEGPPLPVISLEGDDGDGDDSDDVDEDLLEQARSMAERNPQLSSSLLERRLKIGGSRASQIIEVLQDEGLVAPR